MPISEERYVELVEDGLRLGGLRLEPGARTEVLAAVRDGIARYGGDGAPVRNELGTQLEEAMRQAGERVALRLRRERLESRTLRDAPVTADEFRASLASLCPGFWPFC